MERDYEGSFKPLDELLKSASSEVGKKFKNSIFDFIGVTKRELISIMDCTIKNLKLPSDRETFYLNKAHSLII